MADESSNTITSRKEARLSGLSHYFTGRPCLRGHVEKRYVSTGDCFLCLKIKSQKNRRDAPEKARASKTKWRLANPEKQAALMATHRLKNRQKIRDRGAQWRIDNPQKAKAARLRQYQNRKEILCEKAKSSRIKNPDRHRAALKKYKNARKDDPKYRLTNVMRTGISRGLSPGAKAWRKTFDLLGYSLADLRAHLERLFQPGMAWENYGQWHVDHKIPLIAFNYTAPDHIDFQRAWALDNLQPLWAIDNIRKSDRMEGAFQPSLPI